MQGSDPSGKQLQCVPLPPPVDVSGLQAQIDAERSARESMDVILQDAIDELRPANIVGTYSFTGTHNCLTSSLGFNPDFTPVAAPIVEPPPPPDPTLPPPPPVQIPTAVVTTSSGTVSGIRTFNADGTGTAQFRTQTVSGPGFFFNIFGPGITTAGGATRPSGSASIVESETEFTWEVVDGKLMIHETGGTGKLVVGGGIRNGWTAFVENVPPSMGHLGKDLKNISITHDTLGVEISVLRSPAGQQFQEFRTPRVCHRERTLRKM